MNISEIKKFAIAARKKLIQGVINKISTLGFNAQGEVTLEQMPVLAHNDTNFNGRIIPGTNFYHQWMSLHVAIQEKGVKNIYEEVAYTWFNRLVAIRILQKQEQSLITNVLDFVDDSRTPSIVNDARHDIFPEGIDEKTMAELNNLLRDDNKTTEQFAILITAFCHATPMINKIFGRVNDYTELLLPSDILAAGGFVDMLNNSPYITDDDYKQTELIGWLYQFYISERKDEVFKLFKSNHKASSDEVPTATQIFTPNWIVKYMVENTLGRIYLDNHPNASFKDDLKYLVKPSEGEHPIFEYKSLENLRCADFSCGSGHILGEFFDLLYRLYEEEWYDGRTAIENIFKHNLAGIDLDTRAMQLSTFALMLKACQKDESFKNAECMPQVLDMPSIEFNNVCGTVNNLFEDYNANIRKEVTDAFRIVEKADELGSIMKFNLCEASREAMAAVVAEYREQNDADAEIVKAVDLMLMLTDKYSAIAMNPPYMKSTNMNKILGSYVDTNYPAGAMDMFSVFMQIGKSLLCKSGRLSMIVQPTWLVNSTFAALRSYLFGCSHLESLLHMGRGNFGNDWGSIAFCLCNALDSADSQFFKLYERTFYRIAPEHISELFLTANTNHYFKYEFSKYSVDSFNITHSDNGRRIFYQCSLDKFDVIPNHPYCYSFSDDIINTITTTSISTFFNPATGLQTGDNKRFIKSWYELSYLDKGERWFPLVNGGDYRKWYGNLNDWIMWENNGQEIRSHRSSVIRNQQYYFTEGVTWNRIASRGITLRAFPPICMFDQAGDSMFGDNINELHLCMGYLNSTVGKTFFDMLAPGLNLTAGTVASLPYINPDCSDDFLSLVRSNISISKQDWDAHETSWDFNENELVRIFKANGSGDTLEQTLNAFIAEWAGMFYELHSNEEELNEQFINIYGLHHELTKDVPLNEVTILQQKEITIDNGLLKWNKDVIIKQLISYAMGCWMGRYRLDRPGLHIAHPNPTEQELQPYTVNGKTFDIDEDGIVPLMDEDAPFPDNAEKRMKEFVEVVFGSANKAKNIDFINATLGRNINIAKYLKNDFWKDHLARYQKRPIYWLFQSSRKNPAFQVLVYMHRMDAYTCEKVRTKYLLVYIEHLKNRILYLKGQPTTAAVTRELTQHKAALKECLDYEARLHNIANQQISFDLDDGVKVNYAKFGDVLAAI